jgi:hypothetical protein
MPWWALVPAIVVFGYVVWSAYHEHVDRKKAERAVKTLHERRLASTLSSPKRPRPLDVRPALRRDRESK